MGGFYDSETKKLYIVTEGNTATISPYVRFVVEHELTHALQDQNYDLQKLLAASNRKPDDKEGNDDRDLALLSLVEGDATLSQILWIQGGYLSPTDLVKLQQELGSFSGNDKAINDVPPILRESLGFPYDQGAQFMQTLYKQGGWVAVNKAWQDYRPVSTSQILHPEKYQKRIEPVQLEMPDLTGTLGSGWKSLDINTLGEFQTRVWLRGPNAPQSASGTQNDQATKAADGWAGDRYQVLENNGKLALAWRTTWDSNAEATEFLNYAAQQAPTIFAVSGTGGTGSKRVWTTGDREIQFIQKGKEVLIVTAPKGDPAKIINKLGFAAVA